MSGRQKWTSTLAADRKAKPRCLTLTPEANASLDRQAAPRARASLVSAAILAWEEAHPVIVSSDAAPKDSA